MPKIRKFRDLSCRQQNRCLLLQTKYENITSRENLNNTTKDSACTEYLYEDNSFNTILIITPINFNTIESPRNVTNITNIQSEDDTIQFADFVVSDSISKKIF